jgi:hypothetical protein
LSKDIHDTQQRIEPLFNELAALTDDYERRSREFEEQLKEVA